MALVGNGNFTNHPTKQELLKSIPELILSIQVKTFGDFPEQFKISDLSSLSFNELRDLSGRLRAWLQIWYRQQREDYDT